MPKPAPRSFTLSRKTYVTPNMLRLTFAGEGMTAFPLDQESAYIKLNIPVAGNEAGVMRTYTVRRQRDDEIDVDVAMHEDAGPAASWARDAKPGDEILIGGPGPAKRLPAAADWNLLIGDMTSLPAIGANLERLPADAQGYAIIEVTSQADIQWFDLPAGMRINWLINPHPGSDSERLVRALREFDWLPGTPGIWVACEFSAMRKLRRHLIDERGVDKREMYISSYWKLGSSEDGHRVVKREDADQEAASA
ncbi:siderophore-interacting protein [Salinicola rhizosphaerae]|uniref:Siderophore-interacting protein n=1 Tax=Salinicola rhizosphaerae TaxID=1443141 RepID=A0ABQ3E5U8_9GAMM|nr:siderophore-interacting protein [Salinicola rhizosphaerae]GHB27553.1 siderophore-interacting protein [Salinicola rhizosphaerae]